MSNTYRIHGARFLRKYTAAEKSSNFAYMADVRKIADTLCKVPWDRVSADVAATNTIHTEEGLDWNAPERERFDAAEWCAEHSDGFHRAYAQAACYVFKLPDSAVGKAIEKIRVSVTSDPYNPYGARIAAMTSATLDIPMDCATVREGEVFRAPDEDGMGAAPRLFRNNADGTQTWYSNSEIVDLEPGETLTAKRYLFVFVCLENYNRGRDGWIEGSSYIDNDVELTLSAAASDFVSDELNDCSAVVEPVEFQVVKDGVVGDMTGMVSGVVAATVTSAGTIPTMNGQYLENVDQVNDELAPANIHNGVRSVYAMFETGNANRGSFSSCHLNRKRIGVGFSVRQASDVSFVGANGVSASPRSITLTASSLFIPFSLPSWKPSRVAFDWSSWLTGKSPTSGSRFAFYLKPGVYLTEYDAAALKSATAYKGAGLSGWQLLGTAAVGDGSATFDGDFGEGSVGTLLVMAYLPQDAVSNTSNSFSLGTCGTWYDSLTPNDRLGASHDFYSEYDSSRQYVRGDVAGITYSSGTEFDRVNSISGDGGIVFVGGVLFKCNGNFGYYKCSDDGINWVSTNLPSDYQTVIVYGNGVWCAFDYAADTNGLRYSTDKGRTWTVASISGITVKAGGAENGCIVYFDGYFYLYHHTSPYYRVYRSSDGANWEIFENSNSNDNYAIAIGEFCYIRRDKAVRGGSIVSVTGLPGKITSGVYAFGKYFVSAGYRYGSVYVSDDGLTFEEQELGFDVANFYTNGNCVFAYSYGETGHYYNGDEWREIGLGLNVDNCFVYRGLIYVMSGGSVYRSADCIHWSAISFSGTPNRPCATERFIMMGSYVGSSQLYYRSTLDSFGAYECVADVATQGPKMSEWVEIDDPIRERLHNANQLCVPDVKLIG